MTQSQSQPETVPTRLLSAAAWRCLSERLRLSRREQQICELILTEDAKELVIAERLAISIHTVHSHIERLYRKLSVNGRVQLVVRLAACHLNQVAEPDSELPPLCGNRAAGRCPLDS